jgi:hypothetical protein
MMGSIDTNYAYSGNFAAYRGISFIQEGEIHFIGQTKLDNGTTVGLHVELEAQNTNTGTNNNMIDEAFLFAFGDWGRIEMGSRDAGPYRMYYGTPSALIGWGFFQHNHTFASGISATNKAYRAGISTTIAAQGGDNNRINYFTPRFAGFQLGVAYAPKMVTGANGACGTQAVNPANCPYLDYTYNDEIVIGANYVNKFGDLTVAAYGAYYYATFVPGYQGNAATNNLVTGANNVGWKQWVAGLQLAYAGFTVGGAIGWDNNGLGSNYYTQVDNDTRFYTVGVMYETGPWQMSAGWAGFRNTNGNGSLGLANVTMGGVFTATAPTSTSAAFGSNRDTGALAFGMESVDKYEVGVNYALAPGVKLVGGFMYYNIAGPTNLVTGNSWTFVLGMDFRF